MRKYFPVCVALLLLAGCSNKTASYRGYLSNSADTIYLTGKLEGQPASFLGYRSFNYRQISEREGEEDVRRLGLILNAKSYFPFTRISHTGFGNETDSCIIHLTRTLISQWDGKSLAVGVDNLVQTVKGNPTIAQNAPRTYPKWKETSGTIFYDQQAMPFYYKHNLFDRPNYYEGWMQLNKDTLKLQRYKDERRSPADYWLELSKNGIVYATMNMDSDYGRLYILGNRSAEERLLLAAYLFIIAETGK